MRRCTLWPLFRYQELGHRDVGRLNSGVAVLYSAETVLDERGGGFCRTPIILAQDSQRLNPLGLDFLGGPVVKNPPANVGDTGSVPGLGRSHMLRSSEARAAATEQCSSAWEKTAEAHVLQDPCSPTIKAPRP